MVAARSEANQHSTVAAALRSSLRQVDDWHLTAFLLESAGAIEGLVRGLRQRGWARRLAVPKHPIDLWSVPDCIFSALLKARPKLAIYPLGEAVERAVKTAVAEILSDAGLRPGMRKPPGPARVAKLLASRGGRGRPDLLERFLAHFLFELSIDMIRREATEGADDPGAYRYHYSTSGEFLALEAEARWRRQVLRQCRAWSRGLLPSLDAALRADDFAVAQNEIAKGFERIVGERPPAVGPGLPDPVFETLAGPVLERTGERSGAAPEDSPLRLVFAPPDRNVALSLDWLRGLRPEPPVPGPAEDLVELGAAIYLTGLLTPRQEHLGRRIELAVSTREPERWLRAQSALEAAATLLARDDLNLRFPAGRKAQGDAGRLTARHSRRPICLFSGGLDSLAGAVYLLERGERPVFLSHYANSSLAALQKSLVVGLREVYGAGSFDHVGVYLSRAPERSTPLPLPPRQRDPLSRFLRPVLFLSLACATAVHLGSRRIYIFESGPLAIYPLFSEGQIRTRSVDPRFVAGFQSFARRALGLRLTIENPFLYRTKGEVLGLLAPDKVSHLIARSNSCWYWAQLRARAFRAGLDPRRATHDGTCLPCLLRRASAHAAGVWDRDAGYLVDIFERFSELEGESLLTLADYYRFCENVRQLPPARLLGLAPDLSVCVPGVDSGKLVRMFRRSARELRSCLVERGGRELRKALDL